MFKTNCITGDFWVVSACRQCTLGVSGVGGFHEIDCIVLVGVSDGFCMYILYNAKVPRHDIATR